MSMSAAHRVDVDAIDLTDPSFWTTSLEERQAGFAALRRDRPIAFFDEPEPPPEFGIPRGPGYWALTRYADVVEVSRHPEIWCSGRGSTSVVDLTPEAMEFFGSFIVMDDPRHARQRGIVSRRFTPRQLSKVLDNVATVADELIDDIIDRGEVDLVETISVPFPLLIICDMMGIPRSEFRTVMDATNAILGGGDAELVGDRRPIEAAVEGAMTLVQLMHELAEQRRREPRDDLTSALVHADVGEDTLTPAELAPFFILLAVAGNDTTRTAISHGMHYLSQNPDQRRDWQQNPEEVTPTAVEEIVRYGAPVVFMRRTATQTTQLSGHTFDEGDKVVMFYGSANRDEAVFEDPDRFDVRRSDNPHVGFGGPGPHFCLGAHLARRELAVMFRKLFERLPDIEAVEPPHLLEPLGMPLVTGVKHLKVQFTPGGAGKAL
jgi:methyl-branched lipid omega-hydroxylase